MTGIVHGLWNPGGLSNWYAACRSRYYAPAKVLVFGDSIAEGFGSGPPAYQTRWVAQFQTLVRSYLPTPGMEAGGVGFMPGYYADAIMTDDTTRSGGGTFTETNWIWGPKGAALAIPGTGTGTVTFPAQTITSFRVWYGKTNVVGGQGAAIVDGVTQGTTMNGSAASKTDGHFQDYTVTPGSRTIAIKCTTGSTNFMLNGVQFFNQDETKGVHVWDGAHSGGNSTHWLQSSFDPMWAGFVPALKPNLIIIALGTNDWDSITAAAYLANIDSMLAKIATAMGSSPYSVLLVQGYRPGRAARDGVQVWADMMAGLRARAVGNVASVSLEPPWPSLLPDGSTNGGLMFESTNPVHPQFAGHTLYAQVLADAVRPPPVFEELATGESALSGNPRCTLGDTQRAGL